MNRKLDGWDQRDWLGYPKEDPAGAWGRLPAILRAALVWSFLRNGPSTVEDLARLHDGFTYGEKGPIALAVHEEARWMSVALRRLFPNLFKGQADVAIGIYLGFTNSRSATNKRRREGENNYTWGMARQGEEGLRPEEKLDYELWLQPQLADAIDFIIWMYSSWSYSIRYQVELRRKARMADPDFPPLPDPNGEYEDGLKFPFDMGEWLLQKRLFDGEKGLMWGYLLWRTNGAIPVDPYKVYTKELRRGVHPNGGLHRTRHARPSAYIGGDQGGLKDFNAMIRAAIEELEATAPSLQIKELIQGLTLEDLQRAGIGPIRFMLVRWWRRVRPLYQGHNLRIKHLGMAKLISWNDPEKVSN